MKRGTLYGIGVGPGDPGLMTINALQCIRSCDVIILPAAPKEDCHAYRIARAACREIEEKEIVCLPFLMTKNREERLASHQEIYDRVTKFLEQGKKTGFLTIGDPSVYSTYGYLHEKELQNGKTPVMISGVPSFCAAACAAEIALVNGEEQLHIIPAGIAPEDTLHLKGTRVYMKSGRHLKQLKELLLETEKTANILVYSISNCGMEQERIAAGADKIDEQSGYLTVVIVKEKTDGAFVPFF